MKIIKIKFLFLCCILIFPACKKVENPTKKPPKITVVIIIDQFANHYIEKLKPHFKYAFKDLLKKGVVFTNAFYPHAGPSTSTGHTALNTGTFAENHGISSNKWPRSNKKNTEYEIDKKMKISGKKIMTDGLSDQFVLSSKLNKAKKVFCLSLKSRSAVAMASALGKAIWFDEKTGKFISSKAFFKKTPDWILQFNKEKNLANLKEIKWKLFYPRKSNTYNFDHISNYEFTRFPYSLASRPIKIDRSQEEPYELFCKTPQANQLLLDLAKTCVNDNLKENDRMLLWVSLSSLDPLGHCCGPQSLEIIDMIYHLDKQIKDFMKFINKKVGKENALFVLTADHGICPIPELINKQGNKHAKRILISELTQRINNFVQEKYNLNNIVTTITGISIFFDKEKLNSKGKIVKNGILKDLQNFLKKDSGLKNVWLKKELKNLTFAKNSFEDFYKKQIYSKRVGQLILQPNQYCFITKHPKGTAHRTCYNYDTHVPLIIYQKNSLEKKTINEKVWIPQLPVTLAKILKIPKPSMSTFDSLALTD